MANSRVKEIERMLKELGNYTYVAPKVTPIKPIDFGSLKHDPNNLTEAERWKFTPNAWGGYSPEKDEKKSGGGFKVPNIFDMLTGTLGQAGGAVTDSAYNILNFGKGLFDGKGDVGMEILGFINDSLPHNLIMKPAINGGRQQMKNWTDGEWTWGDIPGVGFLHGVDKGWKRGDDIMKDHVGTTNKWATIGGGLAIDIALDPLTYLTGGINAASKAGKAAKTKAIASEAKKLGLKGKNGKAIKTEKELMDAATESLTKKYPRLADNGTVLDKRLQKISDNIEKARTKAFNSKINSNTMSIPFTNKTYGNAPKIPEIKVGSKTIKNPTFRTEATLGQDYKHVAEEVMHKHGIKAGDMPKVTQKMFGKNSVAALSKSELESLDDALTVAKARLDEFTSKLRPMPQADVAEVMRIPPKGVQTPAVAARMDSPRLTGPTQNILGSGVVDDIAENSPRFIRDVQTSLDNGQAGSKSLMDFIEETPVMNNGRTSFERWMDRVNPFDARTLQTGDNFLDSMANHIADADSQRVGEFALYQKDLSILERFVKKGKYSPEEMKQAIYALEGRAPREFGENWQPNARVQQLVEKIQPLLTRIGDEETAAGVLSSLRSNYFPHVINKTEEEYAKIMEHYRKTGTVKGAKLGNAHDQSRKSFETMADRDNYIYKLEKEIQKATDPEEIAKLEKIRDDVAKLFDTDVVSAITRRVREGIRAKASKDMQTKLSKFGMMVTNPENASEIRGLKKLTPDEAKKLGLGKGQHYIHPKVHEGMKKVDELFTDQGMNKAIRHLNAVTDTWRTLVTNYKLSHYTNNYIGNTINNMFAGVSPSDYKKAGKLVLGYRNGKLTKEQAKLIEEAYKKNVLSGGFITDNMYNFHFDKLLGSEKAAHKVRDFKPVKKVRAMAEVGDDMFRLANYLNGLKKFGSSEKAAGQVREYLFNYNELTMKDRGMRVIVPFWNWTKRNVPLQVKMLMENPKIAMNVERFKELMNAEEEGADYQKESGIKIPGTDYYTSLPSPTHDLNLIASPGNFVGGMLGSTAPWLKMPLEYTANRNLYTGQPLTYGQNEASPEDLPAYLAKNFGITGNIYDAATGKKSIGESIINYIKNISEAREE